MAHERVLTLLRLAQEKLPLWRPLRGPQSMAYHSVADVIGFGGSAGGGKTDFAIGKAVTQHQVVQFFRREGTELGGIIERLAEIVGNRDGLSGRGSGSTCVRGSANGRRTAIRK